MLANFICASVMFFEVIAACGKASNWQFATALLQDACSTLIFYWSVILKRDSESVLQEGGASLEG